MTDEKNIVEELAGNCIPCLIDGKIPASEMPDEFTGDKNFTGKVGIGNPNPAQALDLVGNLLTQGQNILGGVTYPRATQLYSLGSPAYEWLHLYLSGNIVIGGLVDGRNISADGATLDSLSAQKQIIVMSHAPALAGNQTGYLAPWGSYGANGSAEIRFPSGTIKRLTVNVSTSSTDAVFKVYKNGMAVGTGISFSDSETGRKTLAEDLSIADGDLICIQVIIGGIGGDSIYIKETSVEFEQG